MYVSLMEALLVGRDGLEEDGGLTAVCCCVYYTV